MPLKSQIANVLARADIRKTDNDCDFAASHNANMSDDDEDATGKNGGPNHLGAWMRYRKVKGADLAKSLGGRVTPGMVSDLVNSKRALSAKWLRRIAPHLRTTAGMLLDHDPFTLDSDIIEVWVDASSSQRKTLVDLAKVVVKGDGTNG